MSLEVYPTDFHTRFQISNAISILLSVYYDKVGTIAVFVDINDYNIRALKKGCVVYDTEREFVFVLQYIKTDTAHNQITARGFTAEWLLDQRILSGPWAVYNIEHDIYDAINHNLRGLNMRTAEEKRLPDSAGGAIIDRGQLLEKTTESLVAAGLGRRAAWDDSKKQIIYEIYKGVDRTHGIHAVTFSYEQGSARELVISDDISSLKNVCYIPLELQNGSTEIVTVGDAQGDDRRELWSRRTISQRHDETVEAARDRARAEAANDLARNLHRLNFSVAIDADELGTRYNIGDIVACVSLRFDVQFTARVSGVTYTMDNRGEKTEVILGTPKLTAIGGFNLAKY